MHPYSLTAIDWAALPLSDAQKYEAECFAAALDGSDFRDPEYGPCMNTIVENTSPEYLEHVLWPVHKSCPWLLKGKWLRVLEENDSFGSPILASDSRNELRLSPTTARYARHIAQLYWLFGPMQGLHVAEIGGGYGGLCSLFMKVFYPDSYTLYDIPGATALQERYVNEVETPGTIHYTSTVKPEQYDLVIGVASLCELHRPVVDKFGEAILSQSRRGYLVWSRSPEGLKTPKDLSLWLKNYGKDVVDGSKDFLFRSICTVSMYPTSVYHWGVDGE